MKNKILYFIVIACFFLISCAGNDERQPDAEQNIGVTNAEEIADEPVAVQLTPDLPEADFEGAEFTFLVREMPGAHWAPYNARDIYAEEEIGEPINDAVYRRNRYVEGKYNFVVSEYRTADFARTLRNTIQAGDDIYSVYYAALIDIAPAASGGLFHDLFSVPYIDLEMPWWDRNAVR
jgi:hypothetical protein